MLAIAVVPRDAAGRKSKAVREYICARAEAWHSDVKIPTLPRFDPRVRLDAGERGVPHQAGAGSTAMNAFAGGARADGRDPDADSTSDTTMQCIQ